MVTIAGSTSLLMHTADKLALTADAHVSNCDNSGRIQNESCIYISIYVLSIFEYFPHTQMYINIHILICTHIDRYLITVLCYCYEEMIDIIYHSIYMYIMNP